MNTCNDRLVKYECLKVWNIKHPNPIRVFQFYKYSIFSGWKWDHDMVYLELTDWTWYEGNLFVFFINNGILHVIFTTICPPFHK